MGKKKDGPERWERALYARTLSRPVRRMPGGQRTEAVAQGENANKGKTGDAEGTGRRRGKSASRRLGLRCKAYLCKMQTGAALPDTRNYKEMAWAFAGSVVSFAALALLNMHLWGREDQGLLLGPFGATAALIYGMPHSPFSSPRNVVGGHVLSALCGVLMQYFFGAHPWLAAALAVGTAVPAMLAFSVFHPPGGATALIAVTGSAELKSLGFTYAFFPVGVCAAVMVLVGLLINNISRRRRYPLLRR